MRTEDEKEELRGCITWRVKKGGRVDRRSRMERESMRGRKKEQDGAGREERERMVERGRRKETAENESVLVVRVEIEKKRMEKEIGMKRRNIS